MGTLTSAIKKAIDKPKVFYLHKIEVEIPRNRRERRKHQKQLKKFNKYDTI